jgi:Fe-S oxidoreductase
MTNLFPNDEDAKRLYQQSFLLSEFLEKKAGHYRPPRLARKALVHGHCHHKSIMKMGAEEKVLSKLGLDFQVLDSGCCGMAGSFGFEKEHYAVSHAVGEQVLLPAVRQASEDTLIITDGFSCREQIEQLTDRRPLHLAEVLQMALHDGRTAEQREAVPSSDERRRRLVRTAALVGGGALLGGLLLWGLRKGERV